MNRPRKQHPFVRGFIEGMAGLFDVLGVRVGHRTPADDARELSRDVERIAQDFHTVLSKIGSSFPK
jgi:hypothetical protein